MSIKITAEDEHVVIEMSQAFKPETMLKLDPFADHNIANGHGNGEIVTLHGKFTYDTAESILDKLYAAVKAIRDYRD
jgi:hypothetical protein